jgi:protein TonB
MSITAVSGMPRILVDDAGAEASPSLFAVALAVAALIHLILILGVGFAFPHSGPAKGSTRPLEVLVLRSAAPSDKTPEMVDAFAQVDREGGGVDESPKADTEPMPEAPAPQQESDRAASLLPPPLLEPPPAALPGSGEPQLLARSEPLAELAPIPESMPTEPPEQPVPETQSRQISAAQILASRDQEIAELTARIRRSSAAYAQRRRRKAISASTREYKYASYLEAWRRKVERVGNLNYPEEAKRYKMHGSLILHVAVREDGSIERTSVIRSSGFDLLDEAAIRIVELAAPFAPFPPDIRAETDVLDITRTWHFLSSNRLGWEK